MKTLKYQLLVTVSMLVLLIGGHYFARFVSRSDHAYFYVTVFYWAFMLIPVLLLLKPADLRDMYKAGHRWYWNLLALLLMVPAFFFVFLPNAGLLKWDMRLGLHVMMSLLNPWFEETYWRGLVSRHFDDNKLVSFLVCCIPFAISHPLVLGVNSPSLQGWPVLILTFMAGSVWWVVYQKTNTLRGNIITQGIVNGVGLSGYVLANVAVTN